MLATKVYGTMGDWPNESRLSKLAIVRQLRGSRSGACRPTASTSTRCTTSTANAPWDEIWEAMEQLAQQGKILYVRLVATSPAGTSPGRNEIAGYRHFARASSPSSRSTT